MRYLLVVHSDTERWDELADTNNDLDDQVTGHIRLIEELTRDGRLVSHAPLSRPADAHRVQRRNGTTITDRDSSSTIDIAGFYLVECATITEAIDIAARIPDAATHHVTIRPVLDIAGITRQPSSIDAPNPTRQS